MEREVGSTHKIFGTIYVTSPGQGPTIEERRHAPYQRGGFHKAGEGPAFGDSFVSFSSLRKTPCGAKAGRQVYARELAEGQTP